MQFFLILIHVLLTFCLVLPFLMVLFSRFTSYKPSPISTSQIDFACIITCYNNAEISLPLLRSLLQQVDESFQVYVVVDGSQQTVVFPHDERLHILHPPQEIGSKLASIQFALEAMKTDHEHVLIFDPDNLVRKDFLQKIHAHIQRGREVIQARRLAKNLDTPYACLDAMGEIYKNYIERYAPSQLGGSASLAGSGISIPIHLLRDFLQTDQIVRAFSTETVIVAEDKWLQNFLVKNNERIFFAWDAWVYDEKLSEGHQVSRQRSRWLLAYFQNVKEAMAHIGRGMTSFNRNKWIFGLLSILPPLFLQVGLAFVWIILCYVFLPITWAFTLALALMVFSANVLWTLKLSDTPKEIWRNLFRLPFFIIRQVLALFQVNKAKEDFRSTTHSHAVEIEDIEE